MIRITALRLWSTTTIQQYKYTDPTQKLRLTGRDGNGFAVPSTFTVHTIWPWDNHETTHLVTSTLGVPPSLFDEGIAVAYETDPYDNSYVANWSGQTPHQWAKQFLQQGTLPDLNSIVVNDTFRALDPT